MWCECNYGSINTAHCAQSTKKLFVLISQLIFVNAHGYSLIT